MNIDFSPPGIHGLVWKEVVSVYETGVIAVIDVRK